MDASMALGTELDDRIVLNLLRNASELILLQEETLHAWRPNRLRTFSLPFLRVWDCFSGSPPDESHRMMSRTPRQRLDSTESRKTLLATHLNRKDWTPTPYISFTNSPAALEELANLRERKGTRGSQTVTVVDPNVRSAKGLPILDVAAEMEHYRILDPYQNSNQYYIDHYVCVWELTAEEIVGHWPWDDLVTHARWYEDIVMPAYRQHRRQTGSGSVENALFERSRVMDQLHLTQDLSDRADIDELSYSSSEGFEDEGSWDTDDEVEEANATDDMFEVL